MRKENRSINTEIFSVPPYIGLEPLVGRYYPAICRRCGWVGSSEELTEDDAQCTRDIGDRLCLGDCDELDRHDLLSIIQAMAKSSEKIRREPLFWRYRSDPNRAWTETTDRGQVESATRAGWIVQALYANGDTSETEELRKENESLRAGWYKDECDNNRFWPEELQEAKSELAGRDALLQDLLDYDISARARLRIEEALSNSSDMSNPVAPDQPNQ